MAANNGKAAIEVLTGAVEAINPKGIKVSGRWVNFFRYDEVPRPLVGQSIRVEVSGNWIKAIEPLEMTAPRQVVGVNDGAQRRDSNIRRLALLKAAAQFLASKPEAKSPDVVRVAESWEAWVKSCE